VFGVPRDPGNGQSTDLRGAAPRGNLDQQVNREAGGGLMSPSDELSYASAVDLAVRIRRRELSAVEVLDAFIERIEARNPA